MPPERADAVREFKGHSGARLTMMDRSGVICVRKAATNPADDQRLRRQFDKLQQAQELGIPCPRVLAADVEDGLFYFDMEFVPAENLAHAVITGKSLDWHDLLGQIARLLDRHSLGAAGEVSAASFLTKLGHIRDQCRFNPAVTSVLPRVEAAIERLSAMPWSGIPQSGCHGDLTLENMLLRQDGVIVFIDFDVPDQSSWQLDLAKVHQDLIGHWCLRDIAAADPGAPLLINAQIALGHAADLMQAALPPGLRMEASRLDQLTAFHLLRTLPYARQATTSAFVADRLDSLLAWL